jgi:predicted transglutaminase-like cysteine proteinase
MRLLVCLLLALLPAGPVLADGGGLFGSQETRANGLLQFPKWSGVLERHNDSHGLIAGVCTRNQFGKCDKQSWPEFLASLKGQPPRAQIEAVNTAMNRARYVVDRVNWGVEDYWATPSEFFWKDGDCEDYAIAKFLSLRALGFPPDSLRIVVVEDLNLRVPHAILAVYQPSGVLLLDNQIRSVIEADRVRHYRPIYSLNESGWWRHR